MVKHTILCVDDEVDNVDALERLFRAELRTQYNVLKATSGKEALKILDQNRADVLIGKSPITVIISDQRMPQMTGVEFLSRSLKSHPDAIRILLTGYADIEVVIEAINSGQIYRYINKPWDPVDLVNTINKAVERYELGQELVETNQKLRDALEELQTLDQAKNQFMVLVNHELKTPLTTMLSFADLLSETKLDVDQERYLSRINAAAHRLQDMINDSLELVSAETQQTKLDLKSLKSKELFSENVLTDPIQKLAAEKHLNLKFSVDNQSLIADERVLKNVFRRLMHNAVKFAEPSSDVIVNGLTQDGGTFLISIENQGKPIEKNKIAHLLKPFTLNENTLNHSVGTGLGLAICQALLKLLSAPLNIESKDQKIRVSFVLGLDPDHTS